MHLHKRLKKKKITHQLIKPSHMPASFSINNQQKMSQMSDLQAVECSAVPYSMWGGLPAVIASCPSFEADRRTDASLKCTFDTLDQLAAACKGCADFDRIASALVESKLTAEAVNRLNSPLLDGLWTLVSGSAPDGVTELSVDRSPLFTFTARWLKRLWLPRLYAETIDLLDLWTPLREYVMKQAWSLPRPFWSTSCPLWCAAGAGREEHVRVLLEHGVVAQVGKALNQAATNGHVGSVRVILESQGSTFDVGKGPWSLNDTMYIAAKHASRALISILLHYDGRLFGAALTGACASDDPELLLWLWCMQQYTEGRDRLHELVHHAGPRCLQLLLTDPQFGAKFFVLVQSLSLLRRGDPARIAMVSSSPFFEAPALDESVPDDRLRHLVEEIHRDMRSGCSFDYLRSLSDLCVFSEASFFQLVLPMLPLAFERNDLSAVSYLVNRRVLSEHYRRHPGRDRFKPLHLAAATGNPSIFNFVLDNWVGDTEVRIQEMKAQGLESWQAFQMYSEEHDADFVRIGARCGQLSALKTWASGRTMANSSERFGIVVAELLLAEALPVAIERNDVDMVQYVMQCHCVAQLGPDRISARSRMGHALSLAAQCGHVDVLRLVLASERSALWLPHVPTMLPKASSAGHLGVIELLLPVCKHRLVNTSRILLEFQALLLCALHGHTASCAYLGDAIVECEDVDFSIIATLTPLIRLVKSNAATGLHQLVRTLMEMDHLTAVSYTHLTLPTNREV